MTARRSALFSVAGIAAIAVGTVTTDRVIASVLSTSFTTYLNKHGLKGTLGPVDVSLLKRTISIDDLTIYNARQDVYRTPYLLRISRVDLRVGLPDANSRFLSVKEMSMRDAELHIESDPHHPRRFNYNEITDVLAPIADAKTAAASELQRADSKAAIGVCDFDVTNVRAEIRALPGSLLQDAVPPIIIVVPRARVTAGTHQTQSIPEFVALVMSTMLASVLATSVNIVEDAAVRTARGVQHAVFDAEKLLHRLAEEGKKMHTPHANDDASSKK